MKKEPTLKRTCPICGAVYNRAPAISRTDNATPICPDCGIRQALDSIGITGADQQKILQIINDHGGAS